MSTNQPLHMRAADPSGATGAGVPDARQRRTILIAVCIALMAVIASVSGLNVAQLELAVAFGTSRAAVRLRLHRARKRLEAALGAPPTTIRLTGGQEHEWT